MQTKKITNTYHWGKAEYEVNHLNQMCGQFKSWDSDGNKLEESNWRNIKRHGLYKKWHPNETIYYINTQKKHRRFGTMIQFEFK
jgi:antitoxin component YwqK of YwqJK toxin-antitoxin module